MKIGIYGDSYTVSHGPFDRPMNWYNILAELLSKKYNDTVDINHYGLAGSSVYYTYKRYIETYKHNDINIVLVSGPGRCPYQLVLENSGIIHATYMVTGIDHINHIRNTTTNLSSADHKKLDNMIAWFELNENGSYLTDMKDLMVDKIDSIPANTIMYPCFSDSFNKEQRNKHRLTDIQFMHSFYLRQLELLGIESDHFTAHETENLCGHMGIEFNLFFANLLFKRILTGKWDHSGFFDVKITQPRKFYYDNFKDE